MAYTLLARLRFECWGKRHLVDHPLCSGLSSYWPHCGRVMTSDVNKATHLKPKPRRRLRTIKAPKSVHSQSSRL